MSARKLRPLGKHLIVLPTPAPEQTAGGLVLPSQWLQPTGQATVIAVGNLVTDVKAGDTVFYSWINGTDVEHEGQKMRLLDRDEILAKQDKAEP